MMPSATIPSPPLSPPPRDPALRLWVVLARAFDAVERHSRASIARFDLGTTEFGVLEVLYHKGRLPVCEVQRRILIESGSTTYVVDKLVRRGVGRRGGGGGGGPPPAGGPPRTGGGGGGGGGGWGGGGVLLKKKKKEEKEG